MLYSLFCKQRDANPQKTAVVWQDRRYTYQEISNAAEELSAKISQSGINPGDTVALLVPNSAQFVIGALAIWANRAVILPLNTAYTQEEVSCYLENSNAQLVIFIETAEQLIPASLEKRILVDCSASELGGSEIGSSISNHSLSNNNISNNSTSNSGDSSRAQTEAQGDANSIIMFSSGSTGTPKQVARTQANIKAEVLAAKTTLNLSPSDTIFCCVPLFHAHGFGNCFLAAIMNGGTLVINHGEFNARKAAKRIAEYGVTIFPSVPFICKILGMTPFKTAPDFSKLRLIYTAGAPLDEEIYNSIKERFALSLGQLYGSTETGAAAINTLSTAENWRTVGNPLDGTTIKLLSDDGSSAKGQDPGEVVIYSKAAAAHYEGLQELSDETFIEGGYHTGDLGVMDHQGNLSIVGRKKLMINVAGNKVDPADIERIVQQIPGVTEVVALGKPDKLYGEAVKVAITSDGSVTQEMVSNHCAAHLVEYKTPKIIEFVDEIPKSPLGKVLRKYL